MTVTLLLIDFPQTPIKYWILSVSAKADLHAAYRATLAVDLIPERVKLSSRQFLIAALDT